MTKQTLEAPPPVRWIVRTLEEEGYETWAVGGAVRDAFLGREGGDWDLATRARPETVRRLFPRTVPIGIDHGTVGILDRSGVLHEVTTFRKDVRTFGRRAEVEFADRVEEDLARRDFTINTLAWHPLRGELRDPFQGRRDLEEEVLRTVGAPRDRFHEDYLRILRALRFAGHFSLTVEEATWTALSSSVEELPHLSPERIREELMKVLSQAPRPSASLGLYGASGALEVLYPELEATVGAPRLEGEPGDVWTHGLLTADHLPARRPLLRLGALLQGVENSAALLIRYRFSNAEVEEVAGLATAGCRPPSPASSGAELRRWLSRVGRDRFRAIPRLWIAGARADAARGRPEAISRTVDAWRALRGELKGDPPLTEGDLALDGRDLIEMGLRPGPLFGRILSHLLDRVLQEPSWNVPGKLREMVREFLASERGTRAGEGERRERIDGGTEP